MPTVVPSILFQFQFRAYESIVKAIGEKKEKILHGRVHIVYSKNWSKTLFKKITAKNGRYLSLAKQKLRLSVLICQLQQLPENKSKKSYILKHKIEK